MVSATDKNKGHEFFLLVLGKNLLLLSFQKMILAIIMNTVIYLIVAIVVDNALDVVDGYDLNRTDKRIPRRLVPIHTLELEKRSTKTRYYFPLIF